MSSFRNIIARRRPSGPAQVDPVQSDPDSDAGSETERFAALLAEISPDVPTVRPDTPPAPPEPPVWETAPPRQTMGADLLKPRIAAEDPDPMDAAQEDLPQRRKIWDIDPSETVEPASATLAEPPLVLGPETSTPPRGGRVKTRLLGFHSNEAAIDPFAVARTPTAPEAITCPVGWVVVIDGPGRGAHFALAPGLSTLGRGADQTISLDFGDDHISRDNHASIAYDEEENTVLIGHGGKSNLVRVNGKPLVSSAELHNGDVFRIGKTSLRFVALCGPDFSWQQGQTGAGD